MVSNCEFLDERENIEIVWEEVFLFFGIAGRSNGRGRGWRVWIGVVHIEKV
jgi:hypothetical protein